MGIFGFGIYCNVMENGEVLKEQTWGSGVCVIQMGKPVRWGDGQRSSRDSMNVNGGHHG